MWDNRAQILKLDPDSPTFLVDQGYNSRQEVEIRMKGVYAPEKWQNGFAECMNHISEVIKQHSDPALKWPFYIIAEKTDVLEPREKMTFTRYVGDVWFIASSPFNLQAVSLNQIMIDFLKLHPEFPGGIGGKSNSVGA